MILMSLQALSMGSKCRYGAFFFFHCGQQLLYREAYEDQAIQTESSNCSFVKSQGASGFTNELAALRNVSDL